MASRFFYQVSGLLNHHSPSSFSTKSERFKILRLVDKQLGELGFKRLKMHGLKAKHIKALLLRWEEEGLSPGTIKNRMAHVRWLCEKIGKKGMISSSNTTMGIPLRQYVTNENKARELTVDQVDLIPDQYLKISLQLQAAFGLRREECMKMHPGKADAGDHLLLESSWCKGGRDRSIPILTGEQRELLELAKVMAKGGSLIPQARKYVEQMKRYENVCIRIGLNKAHGLRHRYAHQRYFALTGFECPAVSGVSVVSLSGEERLSDRQAREIITRELGHERLQVTSVYLGR